jgi:CHAT domain-containing protein
MESLGESISGKAAEVAFVLENLGRPNPEPTRRQLFLSGPYNAQEAKRLSDYAEQRLRTRNARDREQALLMQERSLQIRQRVLGPEHPLTLQSLQRLGLTALEQGQYEKALLVARKAMFAQALHLQRIFSFSDEQHRLAYRATISPFSTFASLPEVPTIDLATAALRFKGAVLDSLLAERQQADASQEPSLRPLLTRISTAREAWRQLESDAIAASSNEVPTLDSRRAALESEFQEIARDFERAGLGTGGLAVSTTPNQIVAALAPDVLLIEIIRYPHHVDRARFQDRYGAILLAAASNPVWIPLGPAIELERLVASYRKSVRGETDKTKLHADLRKLHDWLWLPIERAFQRQYKRVIISPDGALNIVSFATLLTQDDHFLAEKVAISYVASGRDIIAKQPPGSSKTLVICAAPDFKGPAALARPEASQPRTRDLMRPLERNAYRELNLQPLDGALREAAMLREIAARWDWNVRTLAGGDAFESALQQVRSPRVLHIATHGFFLAEGDVSASQEELSNPMRRSGLALCGAQTTLRLWEEGVAPPSANDGILTAEEASTLQLSGTWIVILSACDTGAGEVRFGEGVLGLRRGFIQAGAQNLLMTLWSIPDDTTVEIMLDFYQRAFAAGDAPRALAETQRDWLVNLRNEKGLLYAVNRAGPFIMSIQGNAGLGAGAGR